MIRLPIRVLTRAAPVLALAATLAGCSIAGGPSPQTFTLIAPATIPDLRGSTNAQLLVTEPIALDAVNTERIVVTEGTRLSYYPGSQWVDRLPVLIQTKIVESFVNSGRAPAVGVPGEGLSIDYALLTEIRAFEYDAITGIARVDIFARIMNDRNGRVVTTRLFSSAASVPADNAETVSAALNLALQDILGQLVNWTLAAI
ncbi:MAG: membrane integrity-associated transporter subunit PqiC [Bauldia sp.]|nr:membrane integrity-associated transporter subunit PqiC [Bauldia sp.]